MTKRTGPFPKSPNSRLPGRVSHPDPANDHTTHGQPKGSGGVPTADNQSDGTANKNDSPAGTTGLGGRVS